MKRYLFLILILACLSYNTRAQNIKVEATLDKISIPMGDQTRLHIMAHIRAKDEITFPQLADSIGKILIVSAAKPDTAFDKNDLQAETITRNYTLTCFTPGTYKIPPFTLHTKTGSFTTDTLILQFKPIAVDTTKAIYDIKQPMAVTFTWLDWLKENWPWVAAGLGVLLLITGLIYYFKKRPKKEVVIEKPVPALPADIIAINKLNDLRDKKLWQQNEVKLYHSELSDTVREYLENRYHVNALEQTSDEIFAGLKYLDIAQDERNKLRQILVLADLVKFAKEKPLPADNELSMDNAVSFIIKTRQETVMTDNKEELPK